MPATPGQRPTKPPEPRDGYIAVGWIRGPHGIRGELRVEPMTDTPQRFQEGSELLAGGSEYTVRGARIHRRALIVSLDGVETRDEAEALRGLLLEVPEGELPELEAGAYYRFDIVGMEVYDTSGAALGRIEQVLETGANDVYIVQSDEGELLVPAIDSVVKDVDVPGRRMVIELLKGMERKPPARPKKKRYSSGKEGSPAS